MRVGCVGSDDGVVGWGSEVRGGCVGSGLERVRRGGGRQGGGGVWAASAYHHMPRARMPAQTHKNSR